MNWDQFKQGSWWLLEISRGEWEYEKKFVFMVTALRKGSNIKLNKLAVQVYSIEAPHDPFYITIDAQDEGYTITPLPNRRAAMDLLDLLRRNDEQ